MKALVRISLLILSCFAVNVIAQSMMVLGGGSYARDCFNAAGLATMVNSASSRDVEPCTMAIQHGQLNLRDMAATRVNRGIVFAAMEDYKKAAADYQMALKVAPELPEIYVNIGNLYFLSKRFDLAIEHYSSALERNLARSQVALVNRGMAYEYLGDLSQAENDYLASLEAAPEFRLAKNKLDRVKRKIAGKNNGS